MKYPRYQGRTKIVKWYKKRPGEEDKQRPVSISILPRGTDINDGGGEEAGVDEECLTLFEC